MTDIYLIQSITGIYSLLMIIIGTASNMIALFVCIQKSLRKVPSFVLMIFMLLSDTTSLYYFNLSTFYNSAYGTRLENQSHLFCKTHLFMQYLSWETSAWLLVSSKLY